MGTVLRPPPKSAYLLTAGLLTAALVLVQPGTALAEWPVFRGDSTGSAPPTAASEGTGHLRIKWVVPIPGTGHSTPVFSDGILYVTTARKSAGTSWLLDGGLWLYAAAASGMMLLFLRTVILSDAFHPGAVFWQGLVFLVLLLLATFGFHLLGCQRDSIRRWVYSDVVTVVSLLCAQLLVDRNRRKVRDLNYDVATDDMVSPDLTIFSDDISEPNIQEMAWQKRPDEIGWFVKDSNIVTLTYNPRQGVAAWTEIATDGNYVSVCVIPGVDEDEVWVAVERDCNDYIMIEKFHKQNWIDDVWFVDSGLEYSGDPAATLTGLGHLEGKSVQVYSDANGYIGDFTVSSGSITLDSTETQAVVGLGYTATIKTMPIEVAGPLGPSVGMTKNLRQITLCLYESEGGRYGYDTMYDIKYPSYTTDFFTGLARHGMDTGYQMEVYVIIDQNEPLPLGVTGIAINKYELSTDF